MACSPNSIRVYDFDFPHLETRIRVEEWHEGVVVRASRDTFSEERKRCFIKELAAEGFIPERFNWFPSVDVNSFLGVCWIVDSTWTLDERIADNQSKNRKRRFLFGGGLALAVMTVCLIALRS